MTTDGPWRVRSSATPRAFLGKSTRRYRRFLSNQTYQITWCWGPYNPWEYCYFSFAVWGLSFTLWVMHYCMPDTCFFFTVRNSIFEGLWANVTFYLLWSCHLVRLEEREFKYWILLNAIVFRQEVFLHEMVFAWQAPKMMSLHSFFFIYFRYTSIRLSHNSALKKGRMKIWWDFQLLMRNKTA